MYGTCRPNHLPMRRVFIVLPYLCRGFYLDFPSVCLIVDCLLIADLNVSLSNCLIEVVDVRAFPEAPTYEEGFIVLPYLCEEFSTCFSPRYP